MRKELLVYKSNMERAVEDIAALNEVYKDALDFIEEKGLSNDFILFHSSKDLYRAKQELEGGKRNAEESSDSKS